MIDTIILISFLLLSFFIFLINNYYLLIFLYLLVLLFILLLKINFIKYLKFIKNSILFLLFIFICNIFFSTLLNSMIVIIRLFLILNYSYIISYYFNYSRINNAFYYLMYPLKIFKIDIKKISMIINISLCFIPIFMDEVDNIKISLLSMGFKFNIRNAILKPHIFITAFINGILDRVNEIDYYLISSGFN